MKHLTAGVVLVALGLWGMVVWWEAFGLVMRGLVPLGLLVLGSVAVLSSYYRLGNSERQDDEDVGDAVQE